MINLLMVSVKLLSRSRITNLPAWPHDLFGMISCLVTALAFRSASKHHLGEYILAGSKVLKDMDVPDEEDKGMIYKIKMTRVGR